MNCKYNPNVAKSRKAPLLDYLDGLVDALRTTVPDAIKSTDAKAVHQARVTTRRLKAACDVFASVSSKSNLKPFTKLLKSVERRCRDADEPLVELCA